MEERLDIIQGIYVYTYDDSEFNDYPGIKVGCIRRDSVFPLFEGWYHEDNTSFHEEVVQYLESTEIDFSRLEELSKDLQNRFGIKK